LRGELDDLQRRAKACADEVTRIQNLINKLKTADYKDITDQINAIDARLGPSRTRVSEIDAQLASSQGPLEDLRAKLNQATEDLSFLRTQRTDSDSNLRVLYQRGNDTNNRVAYARQNLDAVIKRFQDESRILSDATINLEKARAEEALARLGLEELIAHYSDALPYAIVPNGNGNGAGTPWGNNPSGSALGSISVGRGVSGSFKINSWTNYLSSAFGAGVNPAWSGSVTELFPFSFVSSVNGNVITNGNTGGCGGSGPAVVATGVVSAVRADGFEVKGDDGQTYSVGVAPCSKLNSNRADFILETGVATVVKGWGSANNMTAGLVTCLK